MDLSMLKGEAVGHIPCGLHVGRVSSAVEDNKTGIPFIGRAGKLLDQLLEASGFSFCNYNTENWCL